MVNFAKSGWASRTLKALRIGLMLLAPLAWLVGCGGNGDGNTAEPSMPTVWSQNFDENGGVLAVSDPNSPIYRARIDIPPDAIPPGERMKITLSYRDELPGAPPVEVVVVSKAFELNKNVPYNFETPVAITVPLTAALDPEDTPLVFYWNEFYEEYLSVAVTEVDRTSGTITFLTTHFTLFVVMYVPDGDAPLGSYDLDTHVDPDKRFRADRDGFFHPNFSTKTRPDGNCFGMATYAEWYFSEKKAVDGIGLFDKYRDGDFGEFWDDASAREVINLTGVQLDGSVATKAWIWEFVSSVTDTDTVRALWTALKLEKRPQSVVIGPGVVDLYFNNITHVVTVHRWDAKANRFKVYDNNVPGKTAYLQWNPWTRQLTYIWADADRKFSYEPKNFAHIPSGTHTQVNELEKIYQQAEVGWTSPVYPRIEIHAPVLDSDRRALVNDPNGVTIMGSVIQGNEEVLKWVTVGQHGSPVPISQGSNQFIITHPALAEKENRVVLFARHDLNAPPNYRNYDATAFLTLSLSLVPPDLIVSMAEARSCDEFGACGLVLDTSAIRDRSSVYFTVDWGDGSSSEVRSIAACVSAGDCVDLGDERIRLWKLYAGPGRYSVTVSHALGEGPAYSQAIVFDVSGVVPLGLTATAGDARVDLSWANLGADRYNVCRATQAVAIFDSCSVYAEGTLILNVGGPPRWFGGLTNGTTYHFRVEALFGNDRLVSESASATPVVAGGGPVIPEKVVFVSEVDGAWDIFSVGIDGANLVNLTENATNDRLPAVSPSLTKIAFVSDRDGSNDIYVMNIDGSDVTRLTEHSLDDAFPVWSPDGNRIAFISQRGSGGGTYDIYVMDNDGGNLVRLTDSRSNDSQPHWSPDGEYIVFVSERDGAADIFIMKADGSGQTNLTKTSAKDTIPFFSPDGSRIAFVSNRDGDFDLWIMDVDGGNLVKLTSDGADAVGWYSWSPDGTLIAFDSKASGVYDIYVVDPGTGIIRQVTDSTASDRFASWTWYGSKIAYLSDEDGTYTINVVDPDGQDIVRLFEGAVGEVFLPAASPVYDEGGGCFIATAAYGSYLEPRVSKLRDFRDDYLLTSPLGKVFVAHYYMWSPPVADVIRQHESLRVITRVILTPLVLSVAYPLQSALILLMAVFVLGKGSRRGRPRMPVPRDDCVKQ